MKKYSFFLFYLIVITLFSCGKTEKNPVTTYKILLRNFEDVLTVDGFIEPVKSLNLSCPPGIEGKITFVVENGSIVNQGDVLCIIDDDNLSTMYDEANTTLINAEANLNKLKAQHNMQSALLEAQVKSNEAETSLAQLDTSQLKFLSENQRRIKELELQKTEIERNRFSKKVKALQNIQRSELRRFEMEIQRATMRLKMAKEKIDGLSIKAPINGLVVRGISYFSQRKIAEGDIVWEGMPLINMPELNIMKVIISASEGNYKRININDKVEYSFDAMPENKAWGKITKKAPVGQPISNDSKVKFFEIEATVDSFIVIPGPGLSAECKVMLKRVPEAIVIPQIAIFEEDSMKVVYVKTKNGFELRQIETGVSSPNEAVIIKGLAKDERIALSKPQIAIINQKKLLPDSTTKKVIENKNPKQNNIQLK